MNDTVVVSAGEDNFKKLFLGEKRWHSIGIAQRRILGIKWIAVYRKDLHAITHIAPVLPGGISECKCGCGKGKRKYVLEFKESAQEIDHIYYDRKGGCPQARRYTSKARLEKAKTTGDLW